MQFAVSAEALKPVIYGELAVVRLLALNCGPVFEVEGPDPTRRWKFPATAYAPPAGLRYLVAGASMVAAAAGLSPVYMRSPGGLDQGSPEPIRLRPSMKEPMVAPQQAASLWRLLTLS